MVKLSEKLSGFLSEFQRFDKTLVLLTVLDGILLQYVLSSDLDFLDKVMASGILVILVLLSAIVNEVEFMHVS